MRLITTVKGETYPTPLFLPVFEYGNPFITIEALKEDFDVKGVITNAFFFYKQRELKLRLMAESIKDFLGFDGLVVTDSGAFQALSRPLYLSNSKIIRFQQDIGADIISPLDLITTPGDNKKTADRKLNQTLKRIKQGLLIADHAVLIGVQQGGRFLDLRQRALMELRELGVRYTALGSLVPFFNRNHNIELVGKVIRQAREILPSDVAIHLYGAGDPLELPFYIALGCDVFDSSSFIHYARDEWYMTPYGALKGRQKLESSQYDCSCPYCRSAVEDIWQDKRLLAAHNLWTILEVVRKAGQKSAQDDRPDYLSDVIEIHQQWFPESQLRESWESICEL